MASWYYKKPWFARSCAAKCIFSCKKGKSVVVHFREGPELGRSSDGAEKRKKPSTQRDLNPGPLCHEACALPLCYNHCPTKIKLVKGSKIDWRLTDLAAPTRRRTVGRQKVAKTSFLFCFKNFQFCFGAKKSVDLFFDMPLTHHDDEKSPKSLI